jgi:HEAT repeat protein
MRHMPPALRPTLVLAALLTGGSSFMASADPTSERAVRDAVAVARELRGSDNLFDQIAGAGTLADVGDKESLQFLADNANHDDWSMMRSAIDMLLTIEHPAGVDLLYRFASINPEGVFLKFLSESLASRPREDMGEFLMSALEIDDLWVTRYALQALAEIPLPDKEARISKFIDEKAKDSATRAYGYLVLMGTAARPRSLTELIELSESGTVEAQEAAAVALGQVDNPETKSALAHLRAATDHRVQIAAMASQAGFGSEEATTNLIKIIAYGKGLEQSLAAASLRRMPGPVAVRISDTLLECCKLGNDAATRLIESWGWIEGDPQHIYDWGLGHADPDIRMQAAWLIGQRGDRANVARLIPLLKDAEGSVRGMAAWAIVRILGGDYDPGVEA